jgi:hypothetical protein
MLWFSQSLVCFNVFIEHLTLHCWVLLAKPTAIQVSKKFPDVYETQRFNTILELRFSQWWPWRVSCLAFSPTLKKDIKYSPETSCFLQITWHYNPEDCILHSLPYSQQPPTSPYPEPDESSSWCLDLWHILFPSGFLIKMVYVSLPCMLQSLLISTSLICSL